MVTIYVWFATWLIKWIYIYECDIISINALFSNGALPPRETVVVLIAESGNVYDVAMNWTTGRRVNDFDIVSNFNSIWESHLTRGHFVYSMQFKQLKQVSWRQNAIYWFDNNAHKYSELDQQITCLLIAYRFTYFTKRSTWKNDTISI